MYKIGLLKITCTKRYGWYSFIVNNKRTVVSRYVILGVDKIHYGTTLSK